MDEGIGHPLFGRGVDENPGGVEVVLNFAIRRAPDEFHVAHRQRPGPHIVPQIRILRRADHAAARRGKPFREVEKFHRSLDGMTPRDPEQIDGFFSVGYEGGLLQEQPRHIAIHSSFMKKPRLVTGDSEAKIRERQPFFKKQSAKRVLPPESPVNLRIQRADKDQLVAENALEMPEKKEQRRPAINNDKVGLLLPQHPEDFGKRKHGVSERARIEPPGLSQAYPLDHRPIGLPGFGSQDRRLVPDRRQLTGKQCHLKLRAARDARGFGIQSKVRMVGKKKELHAGRENGPEDVMARAGFPATTAPAGTSLTTTEPAPMTAPSPTRMRPIRTALHPMSTWSPITGTSSGRRFIPMVVQCLSVQCEPRTAPP